MTIKKLGILLLLFLLLFSVCVDAKSSTKLDKYSYLTLDEDGQDLVEDTVLNKIDANNAFTDCDILECDYKLQIISKKEQVIDKQILKGKFVGNDITITKMFFLDTREVTKTRPTTRLKLKDFFAENKTEGLLFEDEAAVETYTVTELFENEDISKPLKKGDTRTYVIRFKKNNPSQVVDLYHSIYEQDRKDAAWWNNTYLTKNRIDIVNWTCNNNYCQFPITLSLTNNNGSYLRVLNSTEDGELTFWRDDLWNYTSGSGNIWINASNNTQVIYIYYNTTNAVDKSNINDTFIYGDNFNVPTLDSNVYNIWGSPAPKTVSTKYFDPDGDAAYDSGITVSRGINISKGVNLNVYAVRSLKAANYYHLEFGLDANNRTVETQDALAVRTMIRGDDQPYIQMGVNQTVNSVPNDGNWHNYTVRIPPKELNISNNVSYYLDGIFTTTSNGTLRWNASNISYPYLQGRDASDDLSLVDWYVISSYSNSTPVFTISQPDFTTPIYFYSNTDLSGSYKNYGNITTNVTGVNLSLANTTIINLYNSTNNLINSSSSTSNNLTYYLFTGLTAGLYKFNATTCNQAGICNSTDTRNLTIDLTIPQIAYNANTISTGSYNNGSFLINVSANDTNILNTTIKVYNTTNLLQTNTTFSSGNYATRYISSTNEVVFFNATICDKGGNCNSTITRNVTIDTTKPAIAYSANTEADGANLSRNNIFVNVTSTDTNLNYTRIDIYNISNRYFSFYSYTNRSYYQESANITNQSGNDALSNLYYNGTYSFSENWTNPERLADGIWYTSGTESSYAASTLTSAEMYVNYTKPTGALSATWKVQAHHNITNYSAIPSSCFNFYPDKISLRIHADKSGSWNVNEYCWNGSWTVVELRPTHVYVFEEAIIWNMSAETKYANITSLSDATYYFNATAVDLAGNTNNTETRNVTIDTIYPTIVYTANTDLNNSYKNSTSVFINVTASDTNFKNATIRLFNGSNNALLNATVSTLAGNYAQTFDNLNQGMFKYNATVCDIVNHCNTTLTYNLTLDSIPPAIAFNTTTEVDGANISRNNILVNLTSGDTNYRNSTLRLYNVTSLYQVNTTLTAGSLRVNFTGLPDGTYYFNATAIDLANNINNTATRTVSVDTTYPSISYNSNTDTNNSYKSSTSVFINITTSDLTFKNATIRLFNGSNNALLNATVSTLTGNYAQTFDNLNQGMYKYNATACDIFNNCNTTLTYNLTLDSISPAISYNANSDADGANLSRTYIFINLSATDTNLRNTTGNLYNSTGLYRVNYTFASGNYIINFTGLPDDTYYFNATSIDLANNVNYTTTRTFTLDGQPPVLSYNANTDTNNSYKSSNSVFINVSATDLHFKNTTIRLFNGSNNALLNATVSTTVGDYAQTFNNLNQGMYKYNATACDQSNNCNTTLTYNLTLDNIAPSLSYNANTATNNTYQYATSIMVNVTATDTNYKNSTIRLYNTTGVLFINTTTTSGVYAINYTNLADGTYFFNSSSCDLALNCNNSLTYNLTIDTTYPTISYAVNSYSNNSYNNVNYIFVNVSTVETNYRNTSIRYYSSIGGLTATSTTTSNPISYSANFTGLVDSWYYVNATICDLNNLCNNTLTYNITIDLTQPANSYNANTYTNNSYYSSNNLIVNLTGTDTNYKNSSIYLYNNVGAKLSTNTTTTSGVYAVTYSLVDGMYLFNSSVCDLANNCNLSLTRNVTLDTTVPSLSYNSNTNTNNTFQTSKEIRVNITATDTNYKNSTIRLYNTTGALFINTTTNSGVYAINYTNLADGTYFFNSSSCDLALNCNNSLTYNLTIDTTIPALTINANSAANNSYYNTLSFPVNSTSTDTNWNLTNTKVYLPNGNLLTILSGIVSVNYVQVNVSTEGDYYYNITACDRAGNCNNSLTRKVTIYLGNSSIKLNNGTTLNGTVLLANLTYNVSVVDPYFFNLTVRYYNATGLINSSYTTSTTLNGTWLGREGINYMNATTCDLADNCNTTETRIYYIDNTYPVINFPADADNGNYGRNYSYYNISVTDANFANMTVSLNNNGNVTTTNSTIEGTFPLGLNYGIRNISVTACDVLGHCNSTTHSVNYNFSIINFTTVSKIGYTVPSSINITGVLNTTMNSSTGNYTIIMPPGAFNITAYGFTFLAQSYENISVGYSSVSYNVTLFSLYNATILREKDGLPFTFLNDNVSYSCAGNNYTVNTSTRQDIPSITSCNSSDFDGSHICGDMFDGISTTYALATLPKNLTRANFTYYKPAGISGFNFSIKFDSLSETRIAVPNTCSNYSAYFLNFSSTFNATAGTVNISCYNGTAYQDIYNNTNGAIVYDYYVDWLTEINQTNLTSCTNLSYIPITYTVFCPDHVVSGTLNVTNSTISNIDCAYNYWYLKANYGTQQYYRTVIPEYFNLTPVIYMLDLTQDPAVELIIQLNDISGEYTGSKIIAYKAIGLTKKPVIQQYIDVEKKAHLWLQQYEPYTICVQAPNESEECFGDILADQAGTKIINLPKLTIQQNIATYMSGVKWAYGGDYQGHNVSVAYTDITDQGYYNLTWSVFQEGSGIPVFTNTSYEGHNVSFVYWGLDTTKNYYSVLSLNHKFYGSNTESKIVWNKHATVFDGFGDTVSINWTDGNGVVHTNPPVNYTSEWIKLIIALMVIILIFTAFSERNKMPGFVFSAMMTFAFMKFGWFSLLDSKFPFTSFILAILGLIGYLVFMRSSKKEGRNE